MIQEENAAVQQRQCTLAAQYQATQGTEPAQADSKHKHVKNSGTDSAVPNRDKP